MAKSREERNSTRSALLVHRERHDVRFGAFHAVGSCCPRPAGAHGLGRGELDGAAGDWQGVSELVADSTLGDSHAVIDGGRGRPRLLAGLNSHDPGRQHGQVTFPDVAGGMNTLPPAIICNRL